MSVTVSANDERAIEVLASGLPLFQGAQLAVDITIRSVLTASGAAVPNTSHTDGVVWLQARNEKERKFSELLAGDRCRFVVVGIETGGRRSAESVEFINCLAAPKHARHRWFCGGQCPKVGGADGHECCPYLATRLSRVQFCESCRG